MARAQAAAGGGLDAEDLVEEVVLSLLQRDEKWDPARGRYVTFVQAVLRTVVVAQREQSRVVHAPANAWARLEKYRRLDAEGRLAPGPRRTMEAIARALGDTAGVEHAAAAGADAAADEAREAAAREVVAALRTLSPVQALVLASKFGLFDSPPRSSAELGRALPGRPGPRRMKGIEAEAESSLKEHVQRSRERRGSS